jgi:hypothetical protein
VRRAEFGKELRLGASVEPLLKTSPTRIPSARISASG